MGAVARETPDDHVADAADLVSRETTADPDDDATRAAAVRGPVGRLATGFVLLPIRLYRRFISPLLGPRCRYYPTCSTYAEQAVRELGPIRGTILAVWRVLRCNPMSSGGLDPLENRRLFRSHNDQGSSDASAHAPEAHQ